jgi:hypothetical protein
MQEITFTHKGMLRTYSNLDARGFEKYFFSRNSSPISIKCGANCSWGKGIQNCLKTIKGPGPLQRGDNH